MSEIDQPQPAFAPGAPTKAEDDKKLYRQPVDDIVKYIESTQASGANTQKVKAKGKQKRKDEDAELDEGPALGIADVAVAEGGKKKRRRKNRKKNKQENQEDSDEVQDHTKAASGAAVGEPNQIDLD